MKDASPILLIPLFTAMAILFLLAYVIGLRNRTPVRRAFILFASCLLGVAFFELVIKVGMPRFMAMRIVSFGMVALSFAGLLYLNFVYAVVSRRRDVWFKLFAGFAVVSCVVAFVPNMFELKYVGDKGLTLVVISKLFAGALGLSVVPATLFSVTLCAVHYRRNQSERVRNIVRLLLVGTVVSSTLGFGMIFVVPFVLPEFTQIYFYSSFSLLFHVAFFFVGVTKYDLITVDVEEQVRQAEKMESIGRLAGGIAHDFNNQLTGIIGCTDLLRRRVEEDPVQLRLVEQIMESAERSADLVRQMLAFSRKGEFLSVPVSLHGIVDEVCGLLEHSVDKRISIEANLHSESPVVLADPSQLQNAILNLGVNACDAMPDGGVLRFNTAIASMDGDGPRAILEVSDTGVGISEKIRNRVFEPFFTTKPQGQGTGMGLSAVMGTVQGIGGTIDLESEEGGGTQFKICLPLADLALSEPRARAGQISPHKDAGLVMVVDDESAAITAQTLMLEQLGYSVEAYSNGREAIDRFEKASGDIDLVLMDLVMPAPCGMDLFQQFKAISPDVKVLLCSGYSKGDLANRILQKGAVGFIEKPFDVVGISNSVANALGNS